MTRTEEVRLKEQRLHQLLEKQELEGILLKKQANFSWLTGGGYNMVGIATETGMTSLFITRTARFVIANRIEMQRMLVEEGLGELGFEGLAFEWYQDRELELIRQKISALDRVGSDTAVSGLRNMDAEIRKLRFSLTPPEVERYLFLGERLSTVMETVMTGIRPGDTECEIAGRFGGALWKDRIDLTALMVAADERIAAYRHPIPTGKKVGRCVLCCVNARYKGLITSITRTMHFGRPSPELSAQYARNLEIENRMIAATKVGRPMADAFATALEAYREIGRENEWKLHHQGGCMGYYSRDIKVTSETTEPVEENQAFCWNPTITGTKTEDGFIATSAGPLMITRPVVFPLVRQEIGGTLFERPGILEVS